MTQQQLAERLFMPRSQVSDYANNRKIMSIKTAKSVAGIIGCHIDDLYEWIYVAPSERNRNRRKE